MYSILVVDDEPIVCDGISKFLFVTGLNISRVETALNGFEALDYLRLAAFDLVITDIQMGGMNGIELMEAIISEQPQLPIIVISAHEEFAYAQQALRLGAGEYLIKPVALDELTRVVGNMLNHRHLERKRLIDQSIRQKYSMDQLMTIRTVMLNEWIGDERWSEHELQAMLADLNIRLAGPYYCVMTIHMELNKGGFNQQEQLSAMDRKLLLYAALNVTQESLDGWDAIAFYGFGSQIICLISMLGQTTNLWKQDSIGQLQLLARTIQKNISQYLNMNNQVGISTIGDELTHMPELFAETERALEWRHNNRLNPVFYIGDVGSNADKAMALWQEWLDQYMKKLRQSEEHGQADELLNGLLEQLRSAAMPEEQEANCLMQATYRLYGFLQEFSDVINLKAVTEQSHQYAATVFNMESREEIENNLMKLSHSLIDALRQRESSTVYKAMDYMRHTYSNKGLKLQDVALEVHLSPTYLSYLFKKVTDHNLWDYLTSVRMEEAKRLLLYSDKKRYEVSDMIGYESPEHFSRVFKKYYGISPTDFRNAVVHHEAQK